MRIALAALVVVLGFATEAASHRVDDYVQATRLDVTRDGVTIELDLTPGSAIVATIFPLIDRNADGSVSAPEIKRYARSVLRDLTFEMDGVVYPLELTRAESPAWPELRDGMGTIRIAAVAKAPLGVGGTHRIQYENRHRPDIGIYLVNVLVPSAREIVIRRQARDLHQRMFDIEIEVTRGRTSLSWLLAQTILFAGLLVYRARDVISRAR